MGRLAFAWALRTRSFHGGTLVIRRIFICDSYQWKEYNFEKHTFNIFRHTNHASSFKASIVFRVLVHFHQVIAHASKVYCCALTNVTNKKRARLLGMSQPLVLLLAWEELECLRAFVALEWLGFVVHLLVPAQCWFIGKDLPTILKWAHNLRHDDWTQRWSMIDDSWILRDNESFWKDSTTILESVEGFKYFFVNSLQLEFDITNIFFTSNF